MFQNNTLWESGSRDLGWGCGGQGHLDGGGAAFLVFTLTQQAVGLHVAAGHGHGLHHVQTGTARERSGQAVGRRCCGHGVPWGGAAGGGACRHPGICAVPWGWLLPAGCGLSIWCGLRLPPHSPPPFHCNHKIQGRPGAPPGFQVLGLHESKFVFFEGGHGDYT